MCRLLLFVLVVSAISNLDLDLVGLNLNLNFVDLDCFVVFRVIEKLFFEFDLVLKFVDSVISFYSM